MTTPFVIDTTMLLLALGGAVVVIGTAIAYALVRTVSLTFGFRRSYR